MKTMVGSSILTNSYDAGVDTANNALKGIKAPKIGLLFTSIKYNQNEVIRGIKSVSPDLKVIGCTTAGCIMTPDGIISGDNGYAGMMVLEDNELTIGVSGSSRGTDPRSTGRRIAKEAMLNAGKKYSPVAFAMFASPSEEELYLKGIQDVLGEIPMFGGSAADDNITGEWKVFCENQTFSDGCAVALFYTTKELKTIFTGAYKETENVGVVTKVEDNRRIVEINHEPALLKYSEWTGIPREELIGKEILNRSISVPLGVKTLGGELTLVRHPMIANEDNSFGIDASIVENTAVFQLQSDVDGLIEGAVASIRELKNDFKIEGMLLVHSRGRKQLIDERIDEDFVAIKNAAGDIPFIVMFSSNEYGQKDHSGALIGGLSLSFTGFGE